MRNQAFLFLIVLLMVSLGANYIQMRAAKEQHDYRKYENSRFQEKFEKYSDLMVRSDSVIDALLIQRSFDSLQHAKNQGVLKRLISSQKTRIIIREVPTVEDSIISNQEELIKDLENERDTLYLTDNTVIDSLQSQVEEITWLFREQWKRADRFQRDYEREKRKRFSVGPHAGWDFNGPSIGVSVQYAIFRF